MVEKPTYEELERWVQELEKIESSTNLPEEHYGKMKTMSGPFGLGPDTLTAWDKEKKGAGHINTRMETLDLKFSFRESFRKRWCLIIGDGYYD